MKIPQIEIDGRTFTAGNPKAKAWRMFVKFDAEKGEIETAEYIDKHAEIIAGIFPEEVTADKILDQIDLDTILVLYRECFFYIMELISSKLATANEEIEKNG